MAARKPEQNSLKLVEYLRISDDPNNDSVSPEVQRRGIRAGCQQRGWRRPVETYLDRDKSAWQRDRVRPEFERMLLDARALRFDGIVALRGDRLVRRTKELERLIDLHEETGVVVVTFDGTFDLSTPQGKSMAKSITNFAELESDIKSQRLKDHWAFKRDLGIPKWSRRPFGFNRDGTHNENEASVLRDAYDRLLEGIALSEIVREWQKDGIVQPTGNPWTAQRLRVVLASPRNAGMLTTRGNHVIGEGTWAPLVAPATFERAQRLLSNRAATVRSSRNGSYPYLLTGLIRCGHEDCGHRLIGSARSDRPFYICRNSPTTGATGCGRLRVTARTVDDIAAAVICRVLTSARNRDRIVVPHDDKRAQRLRDQADTLRAQRDNLYGLVQAEGMNEDLRSRLSNVNESLVRAEGALGTLYRDSVVATLPQGDLTAAWSQLPIAKRRAIAGEVIADIVTLPATQRGSVFDPGRLRVTLAGIGEVSADSAARVVR